jgi:hypothetical protein
MIMKFRGPCIGKNGPIWGSERDDFLSAHPADAIKQISTIESSLGLADIAQFNAPPPPKV